MPSSSSLPAPQTPPQNDTAAGASRFDRMEAELKTLQQQAQATQQSIKKLQAREPADAYTALVSGLPSASTVDSMMVGVASSLLLALVLLWWYVWHRPLARLVNSRQTVAKHSAAPASTHGPVSEPASTRPPTTSRAPSPVLPEDSQLWDTKAVAEEEDRLVEDASPFAKPDSGLGFDPEAAAGEVMRVRKSLAEKREARALPRDRDDSADHDPYADSDLDLDLDLGPTPTPAATPDVELELDLDLDEAPTQPVEAELDLDLDPWRQPGEGVYGTSDAALVDAVSFVLPTEPEAMVKQETEAQAEPEAEAVTEPPQHSADELAAALDLALQPFNESAQAQTEEKPELHLEPAQEPEPAPEPESAPTPESTDVAEPGLASEPDVAAEPMPDQRPGHDFTITLELAQESAALGLWTEARELATEVLASTNISLAIEARALIDRVNQLQDESDQDTIPWDPPR